MINSLRRTIIEMKTRTEVMIRYVQYPPFFNTVLREDVKKKYKLYRPGTLLSCRKVKTKHGKHSEIEHDNARIYD